jgi:hypothetical protein
MSFSKKRTALLAGVAMLTLSTGAQAQEALTANDAFISQMNDSNFAYLSQSGALGAAGGANSGFIYQHGTNNIFLPIANGAPADAQQGANALGVMQLGSDNYIGGVFLQSGTNIAGLAQFGKGNVVDTFLQTGANRGTVFQGGFANLARTVQDGNGNDSGIVQVNTDPALVGNFAFNEQRFGTDTVADARGGAFAGILQSGSENVATNRQIAQRGSDAAVLQSGDGNVAINTQVIDTYNTTAWIDQYDMGQDNQASIVQFGSGNGAVNSQDSSTNSFVGIVQGGNGNAAANTYVAEPTMLG